MCFAIGICYARVRSMLLNNARICLNVPETESKITAQAKYHLEIHTYR